jgi:hypothetical protein
MRTAKAIKKVTIVCLFICRKITVFEKQNVRLRLKKQTKSGLKPFKPLE